MKKINDEKNQMKKIKWKKSNEKNQWKKSMKKLNENFTEACVEQKREISD